MKKIKSICGLIVAITLIVGGLFFALQFNNSAKAQAKQKKVKNPTERHCGTCVTPESTYPYHDESSSFTGQCGPC